MEVVINISDKLFFKIQDKLDFNGVLKENDVKDLMICVDNGKILPSKHGRLIDADKFVTEQACCGYIEDLDVDVFNEITPTIIQEA